MTEMRKDRRAPASLKVKYKSATVDDFIEQFGSDVSRGGIFIKTKKPLEAGALLKFEFQLQDGSAVLHGVGRVAWRRLEQQARPDLPAGMGIKFFKLSDHSRVVVERIESRYGGNKSRYELSDDAEFAAPMSGPPPTGDSGPSVLPGNGKRVGGGSAPRTMPPPPALSSIPPALKDVPPARMPSGPIRPSIRNAGGALPKGTIGSFFPETTPRKPSASPTRTSGSPANRARDTSEFLASAFHAGGAGPEVRAQARAQAERARRDPESVELARELFGDISDGAAAQAARSAPAGAETSAHETPTHRPPASGNPAEAYSVSTPVPAVELPRSPLPRASRPSLADRIPSMEQLVDEAGRPSASNARSNSGAAVAGKLDSLPMAATQSGPHSLSKPGTEPEPLKLAMSVPTVRPAAAAAEEPAGRSRTLLLVALVSTLVLGGVAAYVVMQRSSAERARNAQAALENTPAATAAPSGPPDAPPTAAAAEPAPQPVAEAPVAGPEVPVAIQAKPRTAEVWIGGKQSGSAPYTTKLPSNVPVEVSVRSAGFATVTRSITPKEGAAPEVFELAPLPYQLVVTSEPAGATIASAGKSAVSPAPLELGHLESMINVTVDKEGFQRSTRPVRLDEFREHEGVMRAEVALALTPLPARRRAPRALAPAAAPAVAAPNDAPPEPSAAPPVVQVKPEGEAKPAEAPAPTSAPEAKAKPAEPPQTAAAPEAPPAPSEPAPN
ncbi:MAG TPA: TIGR02266 family protein [Polyangiales bacterium]|nr:TIGR02266 family protein [Polyangiales bacterium]